MLLCIPFRHPTDSTVFASAGADDQIALWDLALEKDEEAADSTVDPELAVWLNLNLLVLVRSKTFFNYRIWHRNSCSFTKGRKKSKNCIGTHKFPEC